MTAPFDFFPHGMLALPRASMVALRAVLEREYGDAAAPYLQEAGYAGGEAVHTAFREWLAQRGDTPAEELSADEFGDVVSEFFREAGWGALTVQTLHDAVAAVDSVNWGEADEVTTAQQPSCHFTTGLFADFFGRIADAPLAVLEVECRSAGSARCRFLVGGVDVMEYVYDVLTQDGAYEDALLAVE